MNKLLKFPKGTKIVVLTDLHLGHDRGFLLEPRFNALPNEVKARYGDGWTVEEHAEWIKEEWDKHIDGETVVFNLGDVCFNDPKGDNFDLFSRLPCKDHYVLWGNHNSGSKQCYDAALSDLFSEMKVNPTEHFQAIPEVYPLKFNNVTFAGRELTIRVGRQEICMSHFPKLIWDHMSRGSFSLSGHSHGNSPERNPEAPLQKALDVGVENAIKFNGTPFFTLDEIESIMASKTIEILDHHDSTEAPSN
jgi:calcineurin-like phosphoesterase family protein